MVHELFNEDSGILPPQLKGPYGLQQLLAMTADRMWRSQLRAIVTIAALYGSYTIKCSENMQNTHIQKSQHHQTLLLNCFSSLWYGILGVSDGIQSLFPALCHGHFKQRHASTLVWIAMRHSPLTLQ